MDPITWYLIATAVIAAAGTAYSGVQQSKAADAQSDQAEATARYNAKVADNEAEQERLNRQSAETAERRDARRRRATIEAGYAKSGVLIEGTPATYLTEQAATDEYNIQSANAASGQGRKQIRHGGQLGLAQGKSAASAYRSQGQAALVGSAFSATGQVMSTAAWGYDRGYFGKEKAG